MKSSQDLLSSILKTAQMGKTGLNSVLRASMRPTLRRALESQLQEYDEIEGQAQAIAAQRGWDLPELDPGAKVMATLMARARLAGGSTDSRIAGMLIQGSTRGMVKGLKMQHQFSKKDAQIFSLSQKLLDTETANIRQMQSFL